MKVSLERIQESFRDNWKRTSCQVWDILHPFMRLIPKATSPTEDYEKTLGFNTDTELPDEVASEQKIQALTDAISQSIKELAYAPMTLLIESLKNGGEYHEITIPAGCDPGSPDEIKSAFKRAVQDVRQAYRKMYTRLPHDDAFTIIFPAGAQNWFYDALDGCQPATIDGEKVRLIPMAGLLDEAELDAALNSSEEGTQPKLTAQEYISRVEGVAKRCPWYVIMHDSAEGRKPFYFEQKQEPKLEGPELKVTAKFALARNFTTKHFVAKVEPSKLVLMDKNIVSEKVVKL